jgi:hypothetical protein
MFERTFEHRQPLTGVAPGTRKPDRVWLDARMIVDGSYWVGRRAHHFDQRCR